MSLTPTAVRDSAVGPSPPSPRSRMAQSFELADTSHAQSTTVSVRSSSAKDTPRRSSDAVGGKSSEILNLQAQVQAQNELLDEMTRLLHAKTREQSELLENSTTLSEEVCPESALYFLKKSCAKLRKTPQRESCFSEQLKDKDLEICRLQNELSQALATQISRRQQESDYEAFSRSSENGRKPLHYELLMSVLQERDRLALQVDELSSSLTETKAELGTTAFEKEKLLLELRDERRRYSRSSAAFHAAPTRSLSQSRSCASTEASVSNSRPQSLQSNLAMHTQPHEFSPSLMSPALMSPRACQSPVSLTEFADSAAQRSGAHSPSPTRSAYSTSSRQESSEEKPLEEKSCAFSPRPSSWCVGPQHVEKIACMQAQRGAPKADRCHIEYSAARREQYLRDELKQALEKIATLEEQLAAYRSTSTT
eukprot:m.348529 g.348529  ORF g.348529 m.348529 type:complete len:424 (-) comp55871_c0_seq8:75-1346(-)